ncbi:MAG: hypothetical protein V1646_02500 [bacterium]
MNRKLIILIVSIFLIRCSVDAMKNLDEIRAALAGVLQQGSTQEVDTNLEDASKKIGSLEFNQDSELLILEIVDKFSSWMKFPGKISDAIVAFIKKESQVLIKDVPASGDSIGIKELYNKKVDEFLQFVKTLNEKKQNLIQFKLPSKIVISAAWESSAMLKTLKNALSFVNDSVKTIDGLKPAELTLAKKNINTHLNSLNGNIGLKGAITNYLNSEDGKNDDNFIALLMKVKKILEVWFEEGAGKSTYYHNLWQYLNLHRPIPKPPSPEVPPTLPLRPSPLKDKLVLLKTNLFQLRVKLQLLSTKLVQIKEGLEAAVPLGDFVNDVSWWNKAIKSGSIGNNKDRIIVKWNEFSGGFNPKLARKWVMDNVLNDAKKILFFKKLNEISDKILGKEQIAILDKIISAIEAEE